MYRCQCIGLKLFFAKKKNPKKQKRRDVQFWSIKLILKKPNMYCLRFLFYLNLPLFVWLIKLRNIELHLQLLMFYMLENYPISNDIFSFNSVCYQSLYHLKLCFSIWLYLFFFLTNSNLLLIILLILKHYFNLLRRHHH